MLRMWPGYDICYYQAHDEEKWCGWYGHDKWILWADVHFHQDCIWRQQSYMLPDKQDSLASTYVAQSQVVVSPAIMTGMECPSGLSHHWLSHTPSTPSPIPRSCYQITTWPTACQCRGPQESHWWAVDQSYMYYHLAVSPPGQGNQQILRESSSRGWIGSPNKRHPVLLWRWTCWASG